MKFSVTLMIQRTIEIADGLSVDDQDREMQEITSALVMGFEHQDWNVDVSSSEIIGDEDDETGTGDDETDEEEEE